MPEDHHDVELPKIDDDEAQLQLLIEAVVEHQKNETDLLLSHFNELKADPNLSLAVSSLEICKANYTTDSQIILESDSPKDLMMWKLCLEAAFVKLNIARDEHYINKKKLSVSAKPEDVERVLEFLNPLVQRTVFKSVNIHEGMNVSLPTNTSDIMEIQSLIDFSIQQKDATDRKLSGQLVKLTEQSKHIDVIQFSVRKNFLENGTVLTILCNSSKDFDLWRLCFSAIVISLNITYSIREHSHRMAYFTVNSEDISIVLEHIRPLIQKTLFRTLNICATNGIQNVINIIKSGSVSNLPISQPRDANLMVCLDFVRNVKPSIVEYFRKGLIEEKTFIVQLADEVESIKIFDIELTNQQIPLLTIFEMLTRKCRYLEIYGGDSSISPDAAEKILQFCHKLEKKVAIKMPTNSARMETLIGEYKIEVVDTLIGTRKNMIIEHQLMNPTINEMF